MGKTTKTDPVEAGQRAIRARYYGFIRDCATELLAGEKAGTIKDAEDWIAETADGTEWTIYTGKNLLVLLASDRWTEAEDAGLLSLDEAQPERTVAGVMQTLAYHAIAADIRETAEAYRTHGIPTEPAL